MLPPGICCRFRRNRDRSETEPNSFLILCSYFFRKSTSKLPKGVKVLLLHLFPFYNNTVIQGVFESCAEILITSYWLHVELGKNIVAKK
jgi:hypothetical protein